MADNNTLTKNPFRPGAGQQPLYLAGRTKEQDHFRHMLSQDPVSQNVIVTGLRGVGKTVLLEELKPIAQADKWLWTGNDLSESTSLTEDRISRRIVVDLSTLLGPIVMHRQESLPFGFSTKEQTKEQPLEFSDLWDVFNNTPGLNDDKLKAVLRYVANLIKNSPVKGIVFSYDEAQNLSDHALENEYPLSLLLDVFASLQRSLPNSKFMLVLTGLPTLFPKLNEARTYTERMFHVMHLTQLAKKDAKEAITKPIEITKSPLKFSKNTIASIVQMSGGYPFFIQFICKEVFDAWIGKIESGEAPSVPGDEIIEKLDQDFFSPRWTRATDRQQDFMRIISTLDNSDDEFAVQSIVTASRAILIKGFSASHAQQILQALADRGLVYRSRRGGYSFAVPLMAGFIRRQTWNPATLRVPPS